MTGPIAPFFVCREPVTRAPHPTSGWPHTVRQEENQYLSIPFETLKGLPSEVQPLLGWDAGEKFMGWVEQEGKMLSPHTFLQSDDVLKLGLVEQTHRAE
ncbi:hypothetical protein G7009_21590 [Pseudomonas capeferrum]|uniref:hypothetical protein n=1 Tax=Pseudomonas capeferrum TaxID=1495066 RepID=UPI0015E38D5C|nr:hypothetical protein [Pseudomonas capeferrum]MBA1204314.1 hypothetical protein [Pseudomonas capeferrum]